MELLFLHPGQLYAGRRPLQIKTVLGSCIAITLWHPVSKMAAMCHYVLYDRLRQESKPAPHDCDGRYGGDAIRFLHVAALAVDPRLRNFQVGIFGGASINQIRLADKSVGTFNFQLAQQRLDELGYTITYLDVGGKGSRVLQLNTESGEMQLKYHVLDGKDAGRIIGGQRV